MTGDPFGFGWPRRPGARTVRLRPSFPRWQRVTLGVLLALVVVVVLFLALLGLRVQYLFLDSLGHSNVFWTPLVTKLLCFLVGAALVGGLVAANIPWWRRAAASADERGGLLAGLAGGALAVLSGLVAGGAAAGRWETVLLYLHSRDFGASDPVFGADYGFFVFKLPFYDLVQALLWGAVVVSLVGTLAVGAFCAVADRIPEELPVPLRPVKDRSPDEGLRTAVTQTGILLAGILLLAALGAHYGVYHLATSSHDTFVGLDATQRDVTRPVLGVLQFVALGLAVLVAAVTLRARRRAGLTLAGVLGGALAGWLAVAGVLYYVPAAIYNGARVNPNASQLQLPPIADYLATSRYAWGLEPGTDVDTRPFGVPAGTPPVDPTVPDLTSEPGTLADVRIQDLTQLPEILNQIDKARRSYQTYPKVSVDRYPSAAGETTIMLAPREIEQDNLPSVTFANQSFVFTHGGGVAAVSVNNLDAEGNPQVLASITQSAQGPSEQLAAGAPPDLAIPDTRIYCGLQTTHPVVVNTAADAGHPPEFDGAGADAFSSYGSLPGGLAVPGLLDRLAIALDQFKGLDLFLTSATTPQSRILLHREVTDRVSQLAPFLTLDGDPYIVADPSSGHFVFVVDAYLKTDAFPESYRQSNGTSYMRNAVKAVVDARTCETTLYAVDPGEPLTAAYMDIYPGLLSPLDSMPAPLRAHLRYPEDLFGMQAQVFTQAHIDPGSPSNLFTRTDLYRVAAESTANYVELTLPGDRKPSFVLLQTFSPNASGTGAANNMVEWFAAQCDYLHGNHPRLVAVPLSGGNVLGPKQFDNNLNTDPGVSQQLTLLGQSGSKVFLGDIVVLPFANRSFLYVRPFYVQAAGGSFPQVRFVLVGSRSQVAFAPTFGQALQKLFGQPVPGVPTGPAASPGGTPAPTPSPSPGATPGPSSPPSPSATASPTPLVLTAEEAALLTDLLQHQAAEQGDLARGDYDAYGRDQAAVQRDLDRLRQLLGPAAGSLPGTPSPSAASPSPAPSPTP